MSSFLKALGLSSGSSGSTTGKGHKLGSGNDEKTTSKVNSSSSSSSSGGSSSNNSSDLFDVTFTEETLGIKVNPEATGQITVNEVIATSNAANAGINAGDILISVDGNMVKDVDSFVQIIKAIGRPITIRFQRGGNRSQQQSSNSSFSSSVFKSMTGKSVESSLPPMTEEEKEQMRIDRLKAAEDRGKAWDKRIAQGRNSTLKSKQDDGKQPTFEHSERNEFNPETDRTIAIVKAAEARQAAQLGYNPYKPVMSFKADDPKSSQSSNKLNSKSSSSDNNSTRPDILEDIDIESIDSDTVIAIDSAIALLISNEATSQTALLTIQKILMNIISNKSEPKYRTIRLQNPAIRSKVIDIAGGLDLLLASGFYLNDVAEESTLEYMITDDYEIKITYCLKCINNLI
jgi:hypothetical protein